MGKQFSTSYQPKNRKGRGLGKKTKIKNIINELTGSTIGIDIIKVKQEVIGRLLSKKSNTVSELNLVNTVVSQLLEYDLTKKIDTNITEKNMTSLSTNELIEQFKTGE